MKVETRLTRLDGLDVPELWDVIRERAESTAGGPLVVSRPRRRPLLAGVAAALIVALAGFAVGALIGQRRPIATANVPRDWAVRGQIALPVPPGNVRPLLAPSGVGVWVASPHDTEVFHVTPSGRELRVDRQVAVPPMVALVADGRRLWILTAAGDLLALGDAGGPRTVASLGAVGSSLPSLAIAGGRVWVGGTPAGGLVVVDPDTAAVVPVADVSAPDILVGAGSTIWATDASGSSVLQIDATADAVHRRINLGAMISAAADTSGLWITEEQNGTLAHVDLNGHVAVVAANAASGTHTARLATSGGLLWANDSQVLGAFDLSGGPRQTVVVKGPTVDDPSIAGGESSIWVAETIGHVLTLVAPS